MPRRYGQWAGTVLFVVMASLLAGWFWQQHSARAQVLVVARPVALGDRIAATDLKVAEVAGAPRSVGAADSSDVIGTTATVGLVEGQILTPGMFIANPIPGPGQQIVGIQVDSSRAPAGLRAGDVVTVIVVPPSGDPGTTSALDSPAVLATHAVLVGTDRVEGAGTRLSVLVPESVGRRIAAYVAAGRVAVIQSAAGGDQ